MVHSVGFMHVTILNLPSFEQFKMINVFLVGLIPGPDEPKHDINYFLRPFVDTNVLSSTQCPGKWTPSSSKHDSE